MKQKLGVVVGAALALSFLGIACEDEEGQEMKTSRAEVLSEESLTMLVLKEAQEKSLGIRTEAAKIEKLPPSLEATGWVEPRPGARAEVRAPAAGYFLPEAWTLVPGATLKQDALLARIHPVLSPPDELQAATIQVELEREGADLERELRRARAFLDASQAQLERARKLFADTAGSHKALEDAELGHQGALADVKAAEEKLAALGEKRRRIAERFQAQPVSDGASAAPSSHGFSPLPLHSQTAGVIISALASPGEFVEAGRALYEVADLDLAWLRVPIFERDAGKVDATKLIAISLPGRERTPFALLAKLAARSPAIDPQRRTADFFYEVPNPGRELFSGQTISVRVPVVGEAEEALTVPSSAIVLDSRGGSWVYARAGERRYARRRVDCSRAFEGRVAILHGLSAGEAVVTAGAAELFGSEFGASRSEGE